jgi:hypothetical protein
VSAGRLKHTICGRPVAFIGHGHSLFYLDKDIKKLSHKGFCFVSLNQVDIARKILKKIGKDLDVILGFAKGYEGAFDKEKCYVHRDSSGRGNSLFEFLSQCIEIGVKEVYLFGCDGWTEAKKFDDLYLCGQSDPYYRSNELSDMRVDGHKRDVQFFNDNFTQDTKETKILNVGEGSKYELPSITYEDFFKLIR